MNPSGLNVKNVNIYFLLSSIPFYPFISTNNFNILLNS